MIRRIDWDSEFFGREIGVLEPAGASERELEREVEQARAEGRFAYLMCRPSLDDWTTLHELQRIGFYLIDQSVTFATELRPWLAQIPDDVARSVRRANVGDLPFLRKLVVGLFFNSRFYHDPFFSHAEADRLHVSWIENSVAGTAADGVWVVPDTGFVTAKCSAGGVAEIVLIGVDRSTARKGIGRRLLSAALQELHARGGQEVHVKTQITNLDAMNFYHRLGFDLIRSEITLGLILDQHPPLRTVEKGR